LPGQLDALLFGITEAAVESVFGEWTANIAGNWFFIAAMTVLFLPVIWYVTDRLIEPRLGHYVPPGDAERIAAGQPEAQGDAQDQPLTGQERKGLGRAGLALLAVVALWVLFTVGPGTPLIDETGT